MSSAEANVTPPGELVDDMRAGLMRMLELEQTFDTLRQHQQGTIVDLAPVHQVHRSVTEIQQTLSEPDAIDRHSIGVSDLLYVYEHKNGYRTQPLLSVGYIGILLSYRDEIMARERQTWTEGIVPQKWLGRAVVVRRPVEAVTRYDDNWGKQGPLYRTLEKDDEPVTPYYRGGADKIGFQGRPKELSLGQAGRLIIARDQDATEIIEMFEPVRDPKTKAVINYVPRVTIEAVSRSDRLKRNLRAAAINRLGPDLEG